MKNGATRPLGTSGGVVTWSIAPIDESLDDFFLTRDSYKAPSEAIALLRDAFDAWSSHANIDFVQVEDGGATQQPDNHIRIYFAFLPGGTIGLAYQPYDFIGDPAGDIVFDYFYSKFRSDAQVTGLFLREIGHAIGLDHAELSDYSIMTPVATYTDLKPMDIDAIKQVYGEQDDAPVAYTMGSAYAQRNLTILDAPDDFTINGSFYGNVVMTRLGNQTLNGPGGNDTLRAGHRDDSLDGGDGNDRLLGQHGSDMLLGGLGNDVLSGGRGGDTLDGGAGNDTLIGSKGSDVFVFADGHGDDVVQGFDALNDLEKLDLSGISGITGINDVLGAGGAAQQVGADVLIDTGGGNAILLTLVDLAHLDAQDFIF